jgi:cobalt-zinc-cadmium resistance protein CzcA
MKVSNFQIILVAGIIFLTSYTQAQEGFKKMSLEEMYRTALDNNPEYQNAGLLIDRSIQARKSAWDLGMTSLEWTHGQINTNAIDNNLTLTQDFGSPFEQVARLKYLKEETGYYSIYKEKIEKEIRRDLAGVYYQWQLQKTLIGITIEMLSLLEKAVQQSEVRYNTGEANQLSMLMIESRFIELRNLKKEQETDLLNSEHRLRQLIFTDEKIIPADSILRRIRLNNTSADKDSMLLNVSDLKLMSKNIDMARSSLKVYRSGLSPRFNAGYFNQEIDNVPGFQGWQIGVNFPLWFFPQQSRIQTALIDLSIVGNVYETGKMEIENTISLMKVNLSRLDEKIDFYESTLNPNAGLMQNHAAALYETGEIDYLEYLQNMMTVHSTFKEYWKLINEYNQQVIELHYYQQP